MNSNFQEIAQEVVNKVLLNNKSLDSFSVFKEFGEFSEYSNSYYFKLDEDATFRFQIDYCEEKVYINPHFWNEVLAEIRKYNYLTTSFVEMIFYSQFMSVEFISQYSINEKFNILVADHELLHYWQERMDDMLQVIFIPDDVLNSVSEHLRSLKEDKNAADDFNDFLSNL